MRKLRSNWKFRFYCPTSQRSGHTHFRLRDLILGWGGKLYLRHFAHPLLIFYRGWKVRNWPRFSTSVEFDVLWFRNKATYRELKTCSVSANDWTMSSENLLSSVYTYIRELGVKNHPVWKKREGKICESSITQLCIFTAPKFCRSMHLGPPRLRNYWKTLKVNFKMADGTQLANA